MSIKPILISTEMVRAILDGRKTVTRRVVKPQPRGRICYYMAGSGHGMWGYPGDTAYQYWGEEFRQPDNLTNEESLKLWTPPCHTDDILYVRETWCEYIADHVIDGVKYAYRADTSAESDRFRKELGYKWLPSIHMPRDAARIWLRVTDVCVERLHEMSVEDFKHEGVCEWCNRCVHYHDFCGAYVSQAADCKEDWSNPKFPAIWDSTIKTADREKYGWAANPFCWVISFERISKDEAMQ